MQNSNHLQQSRIASFISKDPEVLLAWGWILHAYYQAPSPLVGLQVGGSQIPAKVGPKHLYEEFFSTSDNSQQLTTYSNISALGKT